MTANSILLQQIYKGGEAWPALPIPAEKLTTPDINEDRANGVVNLSSGETKSSSNGQISEDKIEVTQQQGTTRAQRRLELGNEANGGKT